jgi:hypothetical protein
LAQIARLLRCGDSVRNLWDFRRTRRSLRSANFDPVRTLLHHLETCEALPMGGVKVACTIAGNRLDWNDLMLHFRA